MSKIKRILSSLAFLKKGFIYCKNNKIIWKYILIAIFFNLIAIIFSVIFIGSLLNFIFNLFITYTNIEITSGWYMFIGFILFLPAITLAFVLFGLISSIANAPVYGHLSGFIIKDLYKNKSIVDKTFVQDIMASIKFEVKKVLLSILIVLITLPVNLIPVIGTFIYFLINGLQIIVFAGLDMMEPILSRGNYSFRLKIKFIFNKPFDFWPYLLITGFLYNVPVLNIFLIPIFMVGSTLMYMSSGVNPDDT